MMKKQQRGRQRSSLLFVLSALCWWLLALSSAAAAAAADDDGDQGTALKEWLLQQEGGYIHPNLEIRRGSNSDDADDDDDDNAMMYGVYATTTTTKESEGGNIINNTPMIPKGTLLLEIPHSALIQPNDNIQVGDRVAAFFDGQYYYGQIAAPADSVSNDESKSSSSSAYNKDHGINDHYYIDSSFQYYNIQYDDGDYETNQHEDVFERQLDCSTVQRMVDEIQLGRDSQYSPYMRYLLSQQHHGQLPAAWTTDGLTILRELLGTTTSTSSTTNTEITQQLLPPILNELLDSNDYKLRCGGGGGGGMMTTTTSGKEEEPDNNNNIDIDLLLKINLFHLHNQRGWDEIMIPILDMLNHGNGRLLNTYHSSVEDGSSVKVWASKDIMAGEQLYNTYNFCADCENRYMYYGTPEIMRDYGFVENFPQRWFFHVVDEHPDEHHGQDNNEEEEFGEIGFELDVGANTIAEEYDVESGEKEDNPVAFEIKLLVGGPSKRVLVYLRKQLLRLQVLSETILQQKDKNNYERFPSLPEHEWNTIMEYKQALTTAITVVLEKYGGYYNDDGEENIYYNNNNKCKKGSKDPLSDDDDDICEDDEDHRGGEDWTTTSSLYYNSLQMPEVEEWVDSRPTTCLDPLNPKKLPYFFDQCETVQIIKSPYQEIEYFIDLDRNNDMCLMLDEVVQICTSYRPMYHEMVVHNTARYLEDDLKRVLFVGGGDSMLLHNILQYPTLEKVVGLEIDQYVTRTAWHHFGAEPQFENEKVEWWYGDATKSLLMLPTEYFGSFDLVLVDLSETVASMSVTTEMTVMEALSLLLQPKGILVKNEYNYFEEQRNIFRHTKLIHWYKVPWVCSQTLVLGSNGIDLMRAGYKNRGVETIYPLLDDPHLNNGYLHDYQKNYTNPHRYCLSGDSYDNAGVIELATQESSPGIMMIIEAEDSTLNLDSYEEIQLIISNTMKDQGFHVVESFVPTSVNPNVIVTVLQEGYTVVRTFPEDKYCAIDIQLWSSFNKQENAKRALIEAVGSKVSGPSSSSYRIVSGGIFGMDTWKDDEKSRGPKMSRCEDVVEEEPLVYDGRPDDNLVVEAVLEFLDLELEDEELLALLICGSESECLGKDKLKAIDVMSDVLVLKPCSEMVTLSQIAKCEVETWKLMDEAVTASGKKIGSVILDPSTQQSFAQITYNTFRGELNANHLFADNMVAIASLLDLDEKWRIAFVDKFRTEIFPIDPSFRAEAYFNSTSGGSTFVMSLSSSGDRLFGEHLAELVQRVEGSFDVKGEIRDVRGNTFDNFIVQDPISIDHSRNFTDADFFQESQLDHWNEQKPIGMQVLFQFVISPNYMLKRRRLWGTAKFLQALEKTLEMMVSTEVEYKTFSLGEGTLVVAIWKEGSALLLYDGRARIDVNLFLKNENPAELFEDFEKNFGIFVPGATRVLRDTQPRGTGRVVSFFSDLGGFDETLGKPLNYPRWAPPA